MDGRDDNADNVNNSDQVEGVAAQGQSQGIFSTPDLTIDAEKIAPTDNERERSRVASIFAKTETGKQAQKLNDAMGMTAQPAEEDIVVAKPRKKRSKTPIIVAIVVVLAAIGGIWTFLAIQTSSRTAAETSRTLFNKYVDYAKNGPQSDDSTDNSQLQNGWYIDELYELELSADEINEYLKSLNTFYSDFVDQNKRSDLKDALYTHQQLLDMLTDYYSLDLLFDNVADKYLHESDEAARKYVEELAPINTEQDTEDESTLDFARRLEHDYLNARLSLLRRYRIQGCIEDDELNLECVANISDFQTRQEEQDATTLRESLASLASILLDRYHVSADVIRESLE